MSDIVSAIVGAAVGGTSVAAVVFGVLRTIVTDRVRAAIEHEYALRLETHRAEIAAAYESKLAEHRHSLQAQHDVELEKLRTELRIVVSEREIRFRRLHDEVVSTVGKTYELLIRLRHAVAQYVRILRINDERPRTELRQAAYQALQGFDDYFIPRRIWLPPETAEAVSRFRSELKENTQAFQIFVEQSERIENWVNVGMKVGDFMDQQVPRLLRQLEADFRGLIGQGSKTSES